MVVVVVDDVVLVVVTVVVVVVVVVVDWYNFAREVCDEIIQRESEKIGVDGKEVQIDESKFGKRIYHRGKRVDGVWVFGGIERQSKKCFFSKL